jgi:hypothetical protein
LAALAIAAAAFAVPASLAPSAHARSEEGVAAKDNKNKKKKAASAKAVAMPSDACTLVTLDEAKTFVPSTTAGSGSPAGSPEPACLRNSDRFVNRDDVNTLGVMFQTFTGVPERELKKEFAKSLGESVQNLGRAAKLDTTSSGPNAIAVRVLFPGGVMMTLDYGANDATAGAPDLVALARTAAGRV